MNVTIEGGKLERFASVTEKTEGGITELKFSLRFDEPTSPEKIDLVWLEPVTDTYSLWGPNVGTTRHLAPEWGPRKTSARLASGAPVHAMISADDTNRLTIALSDAATATEISTGIVEAGGFMRCRVSFFTMPQSEITSYEATVRLDYRKINYCDALRDIAKWWEESCGYSPAPVPTDAKMPMNSLWYSYHQDLEREAIVNQCRLSVPYGMKTVIVDDGWQTADKGGYSHCGDWRPLGLPDIKETVKEVHEVGMKLILWFSVPFIGIYSDSYEKFKDKTLYSLFDDTTYVLDPRYKDVRDYLVGIYVDALKEYDLDGFKLDFIDSFAHSDKSLLPDDRRDFVSLDEAVNALMTETKDALTAIRPDIMIEFRQSYIGPAIRTFGNMLRVGDCACDALSNRRAIIDLRLTSGNTAVHSDMLMWNKGDSTEAVALQLASVLFSVPQISVVLDEICDDHKAALRFYLDFWMKNRDVLLNGDLYASSPDMLYDSAYSVKDGKAVCVAYENPVIKRVADSVSAVNCGAGEFLYFDGFAGKRYCVTNCKGEFVSGGVFQTALEKIEVPTAGIVTI